MAEESETREWIVYLETDVTVRARTQHEAEKIAREFVRIETYSPLIKVDEHRRGRIYQRVITSERKIAEPKEQISSSPSMEEVYRRTYDAPKPRRENS